ncbi:kinase-like domain-containing protein [Gigaspora rosea]|uniref:Kinase-like domain-containing protein n=1 Tax=Gigaspora rosea TaxID=44941 RepID=A0A397UGH4_9GLOM|nr:kinase-like domain-containing protein [Gigaspora rosea]
MQLEDNNVYGLTQNIFTNEYMLIFDFNRNERNQQCANCNRYNISPAWCQTCSPQKTTQGWTSRNKDVDDCTKKFQFNATTYEDIIEWIPFDRLDNIQEIAKEDSDAYFQQPVYFNKFKNHMKCRLTSSRLEVYGLTQNIATNQYLMAFQYVNSDLIQIHEAGYIYCDFHSGNILQHKENLWLEKIIKSYITDLELSRNNKESTLKKGVYGVMPYIPPEILLARKYTQAAEIYGFGVIMAEIITEIPPFDLFDNDLALKICSGLRLKFAPGTLDCYIKLAKLYINSDPQKRPTAKVLFDEFSK